MDDDGKRQAMTEATPISLYDLEPHQCGVVQGLEATDDELARLMAMGVCAGRAVRLVQVGDPLILQVYGTRVGVSARLARRIQVIPCDDDASTEPASPEGN